VCVSEQSFQHDNPRERIPLPRARVAHAHARARELRRRATPSETALWSELRDEPFRSWRFRRQHPIGPYIVDFFSSRATLIVEIDGPIHAAQAEYDAERQAELEGARYRILRFTANQVMTNMISVLRAVKATIDRPSPHQPPDQP